MTQLRTSRWRIRRTGARQGTQVSLVLRLFFPQELLLLLRAAGLELVARYGDFDRNPLSARGLNQVCLARPASERPASGD